MELGARLNELLEGAYIFDVEGDSLHPTKFHVLSCCKADGTELLSTSDYGQIRLFFERAKVIIGHNIIRWDIPNLERVLGIEIKSKVIDTLVLSWYLEPERVLHGLGAWGEFFGVPKPAIDDWENLTLEEYTHRCEQDVINNHKLFVYLIDKLKELYQNDGERIHSCIRYLMFKLWCAALQEKSKWKLDVEMCEKNLASMESAKEEKIIQLVEVMPKVPKMGKKSKPKVMYKADGELSVYGAGWLELLAEKNLPENYEEEVEYIIKYEEPKPTSHVQIKNWLYSLGWKPETFKYDRNKETNEVRKIPQVKKEGEVCESVKKLYDKAPELVLFEGLSVLSHRIGLLKGFLRDVDEGGYLKAEIAGLTNTLRFRHQTIVNLPGVKKAYGDVIRGCLTIPDDDYVLCGSDMSSLEDRTKQHFIYPYDPQYVKSMMTPDFDPHLDLAVFAGALTKEQSDAHKAEEEDYGEVRHLYKTCNYCLPVDNTQILTLYGWRSYDELCVGDLIYSMNPDSKELELTPITDIPFFENSEVGIVGNKRWEFECTENHRWFVKRRDRTTGGDNYSFYESKDLVTECNIITSAPFKSVDREDVSIQDVRLLGWILADGYLSWSKLSVGTSSSFGEKRAVACTIGQKRNVLQLEECLQEVPHGVSQREDGLKYYRLKSGFTREYWRRLFGYGDTDKHQTDYAFFLSGLSFEKREAFLEAFILADGGRKGNQTVIYQNEGNILEAVKLCLTLNGYSYTVHATSGSDNCKVISIKNRPHVTCQRFKKWEKSRTTDVFCVNNKNQTFIAKQGNTVTITGNSATYGVGIPALARSLGITKARAKKILDAFWKRNWAVRKFASDQLTKVVRNQMWVFNPLSGFWYSLRAEKDIFSTVNQSAGVFCFDMWVKNVLEERPQLTAQFHDEIILTLQKGEEQYIKKLLKDSIKKVNEKLNMNRELDVDVQFGDNYAEIH